MRKKGNAPDGIQTYAVNLIQKISDPLGKNSDKNGKQVSEKIAN